MKLDCEVVKDLYVLYKENELSLQVKTSVEDHLKECSQCKNIYQSESNFSDIINEQIDKPSKKMDGKMLMRLKLSRLRIAIVLILAIGISIFGSSYYKTRDNMVMDLSRYSHYLLNITSDIGLIKNDDENPLDNNKNFKNTIMSDVNISNDSYESLTRDFNYFERKKLEGDSNNLELNVEFLVYILNDRYKNNSWSSRDEKAYNTLLNDVNSLMNISTREQERLMGNKLGILKVQDIKNCLNNINDLAFSYVEYNKFPNEIKKISEDDIKKRLDFLFNVKGEKYVLYNGNCFQMTRDNAMGYSGNIDMYTGRINGLNGGEWKNSGELIPIEKVKDNMVTFFKKNYGAEFDYEIKDLGINHNMTSNDNLQFYCFDVQPMYKGYKISKPKNVECDARTGLIQFTNSVIDSSLDINNENLDVKPTYSYEDALKNAKLQHINKNDYKYNEMFFEKSILSGKYELMYEYIYIDKYGNESYIYINAVTCKQEYITN